MPLPLPLDIWSLSIHDTQEEADNVQQEQEAVAGDLKDIGYRDLIEAHLDIRDQLDSA